MRVPKNGRAPGCDEVHVAVTFDIRHIGAVSRHVETGCAADRAERPHRRVHAARNGCPCASEGLIVGSQLGGRHSDAPFVRSRLRASSVAQYVSTASAPARLMLSTLSSMARSRSIQPFAAAASIIEYSPDTWYAQTGTSLTAAASASTSR